MIRANFKDPMQFIAHTCSLNFIYDGAIHLSRHFIFDRSSFPAHFAGFNTRWMDMTISAFIITQIAGYIGLVAWLIARRASTMVFKSLGIVFFALLSLGSAFALISLLVESGRNDAMWRIAEDVCDLRRREYQCYCSSTSNTSYVILSILTPIVLLTAAATARAMRLDLEDQGEPSTLFGTFLHSYKKTSNIGRICISCFCTTFFRG